MDSCQFYTKIGACRHGEKCSRKHTIPTRSNTVLFTNLYHPPETTDKEELDSHFLNFYKDVFIECYKVSESPIVALSVCENGNTHLQGNVYVQFTTPEAAQKARDVFGGRWYASRPVYCELSPVRDFGAASCRQHDETSCERGEACNFWHVRKAGTAIDSELGKAMWKDIKSKSVTA